MGARRYFDIEIRGVVYPNTRAAAEAFGVQTQTVIKALQAGTLDRLGTGRPGVAPYPVCIRGRVFPSAAAAAAHYGVTRTAVRNAIAAGDPDRVGRSRSSGVSANARPVAIGGMRFASMAAASRALGLSDGYISRALKRGSPRMAERLLGAAMRLRAMERRSA